MSASYQAKTINDWEDYEMNPKILRGIYGFGYEKPSPIQSRAIQPMIDGHDLIAQAQSGTGKTGAFSIGTLNVVDPTVNEIQALILSPTRELSRQSHDVISKIGSFLKGLKTQLLVGGTSTSDDIDKLKNNTPHIIVGCPGRTFDMIKRGHLNTSKIRVFVLDEADEMLSSGFMEQIYNIFQYLSTTTKVALFSATIPSDIEELTTKFMNDPVKILVKSEMLTLEGIEQYYVALESDGDKFSTIKDLYASITSSQCIVYCNSVKRVEDLYEALVEDGFTVSRIHSSMTKEEREQAYNDFKSGKNRILISSNVTARGIDIQQVSTVINFDVPKCVHTYLHRIGRSGRHGRTGTAINLVTLNDVRKIYDIEKYYAIKIPDLPSDLSKVFANNN